MTIESACISLPSEIILPFTGYMVFAGHFGFWQATIAADLGNLLGGLIAYYVGVWGGRSLINLKWLPILQLGRFPVVLF